MNQWLKYHKEVLKEERQEAELAARARKPEATPPTAVPPPVRPEDSRSGH